MDTFISVHSKQNKPPIHVTITLFFKRHTMNPEEIDQFVKAFGDFLHHSQIEEIRYNHRLEASQYIFDYYEQKAAELEITVDYYLQEFV